jgi:hypothetical protein
LNTAIDDPYVPDAAFMLVDTLVMFGSRQAPTAHFVVNAHNGGEGADPNLAAYQAATEVDLFSLRAA